MSPSLPDYDVDCIGSIVSPIGVIAEPAELVMFLTEIHEKMTTIVVNGYSLQFACGFELLISLKSD